ncbi:MAG TPA: hypothetical protein VD863_24275 [Bradyrhizobium sp.]|nr:hypothetical protein [Bradyrhizobium sp.]
MVISEMVGLSDNPDGSTMCHKKSGIVSPRTWAARHSCWLAPALAKIIPPVARATVRSFATVRICINPWHSSRERAGIASRCIILDEQIRSMMASNKNASREIMIRQ